MVVNSNKTSDWMAQSVLMDVDVAKDALPHDKSDNDNGEWNVMRYAMTAN